MGASGIYCHEKSLEIIESHCAFGCLKWVRVSLGMCKMVQNSAVKWFWSLTRASGDEKWGLKNEKCHEKVKMVMK